MCVPAGSGRPGDGVGVQEILGSWAVQPGGRGRSIGHPDSSPSWCSAAAPGSPAASRRRGRNGRRRVAEPDQDLADYVITVGCGDTCPIFPGKKYLDWVLEDPAGKGIECVRPIRDQIKARIEALITEIDAKPER